MTKLGVCYSSQGDWGYRENIPLARSFSRNSEILALYTPVIWSRHVTWCYNWLLKASPSFFRSLLPSYRYIKGRVTLESGGCKFELWLCHLPAPWLWVNQLASLSLDFLLFEFCIIVTIFLIVTSISNDQWLSVPFTLKTFRVLSRHCAFALAASFTKISSAFHTASS